MLDIDDWDNIYHWCEMILQHAQQVRQPVVVLIEQIANLKLKADMKRKEI